MTHRKKTCLRMASTAIRSTSHKGEKLKSFTLEFKLAAINYAERHSNRAATRKYNVDEKRISEWKKKHAELSHARLKKGYR